MEQVSCGEQRETEACTAEIKVMTSAMRLSPMHARKEVNCFAKVGENDYNQTARADQLQKRRYIPFLEEQNHRASQEHTCRHECDQGFQ